MTSEKMYLIVHMLRKGQVVGVEKGDVKVRTERLRVVGCFSKSRDQAQAASGVV